MIPSIALGLGLAGNAIAEPSVAEAAETTLPIEIVSHKKVSMAETCEFYQGDFSLSDKTSLKGLVQDNLYTGQGAFESSSVRFVTF